MKAISVRVGAGVLLVALGGGWPLMAPAANELTRRATWTQPTVEQVREQVDAWLTAHVSDESLRQQVRELWTGPEIDSAEVLVRVGESIALADTRARPLVDLCRGLKPTLPLPQYAWLTDEQAPPFVRHNLRLLYARWLVEHSLFDEALEQLGGLDTVDVVDPTTLLFLRSVCHHQLLQTKEFEPVVQRLLENEKQLPQRYLTVARLMRSDLAPLETDSLDEVARLMGDVQRRLGLGRAGTRVRQQEDDVIAKLDKMIKKLEEQKQQQSSSSQSAQQAPSNPAQESQLPSGGGPGNVDPKKLGHKSGWGNLPPKERQEALQQISKELPAHYREVIEEYFRKLARDGGQ